MPSSYCSASPRVKIAPHGEPKMSKMSKTSFDQLQVVFFSFLFTKWLYMAEIPSLYCFGSPSVKIAL